MRFEVLGAVRMRHEPGSHGSDPVLTGRLQQALLGVLLARANRDVSVDQLLDILWDGIPDPKLTQRLHVHVHRLRRLLDEPGRLAFETGSYRLRVQPGELDSERFERLVDEGVGQTDPFRSVTMLREGLQLWRGQPFAGMDIGLLTDEAARLVDRRLVALEELYAAELRCGRHGVIVGELRELVAEYELRERLYELLMVALAGGGRPAEALEVYRHARTALVRELGLEPGPGLRELERQILAGERVDVPGPGGSGAVPSGLPRVNGGAGGGLTPAQLPHMVRSFVGRTAELAELDAVLANTPVSWSDADGADGDSPARICLVSGSAGVGKTALAVRWAHHVRDQFSDGHLYVDLRGYGPKDPVPPEEALAWFLRGLGVEGPAIPSELSERTARFRTLVDQRRLLIVIDNARSAEQVRPLLPGSGSCFVVVTSRDTLTGLVAREGAYRVDLDRLSPPDALQLVRDLLGDRAQAEPQAADLLTTRCARLPLALRIAAELGRSRRGSSIADLADELGDEHGRLDLLDADGDPHSAVRAAFSWSYRQLQEDAASIFRLFGTHPGLDLDLYALAAMAGRNLRETRRGLDRLLRANLVDETDPGRFRTHDLLRAYAIELAESTDPETARETALTQLFDYYCAVVARAMEYYSTDEAERQVEVPDPGFATPLLADRLGAVSWLDAERRNLVAATAHAGAHGWTRQAWALSTLLFRYLISGAHYRDAETIYVVGSRSHDQTTRAQALNDLGVTYWRQGRYTEAVEALQEAIAVADEIGNRRNYCTSLGNLGLAFVHLGRYGEALEHHQRALAVAREIGDRVNQGRELDDIGIVYNQLGRHADALEHHRAALAIARELGNRHSEGVTLGNIGVVHERLGHFADALEHHRQALDIARELGNRHSEGVTLGNIGIVYERLGEYPEALDQHEEALALASAIGDRRNIGTSLDRIGVVLRRTGRAAEGAERQRTALATAREIGNRHDEVVALTDLGATLRTLGSTAEALRCHRQAVELATELRNPYRDARAHEELAESLAATGDSRAARDHWQLALSGYTELAVPEAVALRERLGKTVTEA